MKIEDVYGTLVNGTCEFFHKSGFAKAIIGLSGGIDILNPQDIEFSDVGIVTIKNANVLETATNNPNVTDQVNDFIYTKEGKLINFDTQDDIVGAKTGGAIDQLMKNGTGMGNQLSGPITVDPITITINGDLTLNTPNGGTSNLSIDIEAIKPMITKLITDTLNGSKYSGGKKGSSLNSSMG